MQLLQKQITKNSTNPKNIGFLELFLKIYTINTIKLSEGYGAGFSATSVQTNFGKDSELTETTSHGAMGSYTQVKADGSRTAVAANRDLNKTQEETKHEESKGKVRVDVDIPMLTNAPKYLNDSAGDILNAGKNGNTLVKRTGGKVGDLTDAVATGISKGSIDEGVDRYQGNETRRQAAFNTKTADLDKLVNTEVNTKKEVVDAGNQYKSDMDKVNNVDDSGSVKLLDGKQLTKTAADNGVAINGGGVYDKDNHDVYINTNAKPEDQKSFSQEINHEIQHDIDQKTGKLAVISTDEAESRANHAAEQGSQAMKDELSLRDDAPNNSGKSTDTFKTSNPELVKQGTADAENVKNAQADYSGFSSLVNTVGEISIGKDKAQMDATSKEVIHNIRQNSVVKVGYVAGMELTPAGDIARIGFGVDPYTLQPLTVGQRATEAGEIALFWGAKKGLNFLKGIESVSKYSQVIDKANQGLDVYTNSSAVKKGIEKEFNLNEK